MTRGQTMRKWREKSGLSQKNLAALADIHENTIIGLENDKVCGNLITIELLADALGLSIDEYVGHKVVKYRGKKE